MKTVTTRPSFQGDLMIRRIMALPENVMVGSREGDHHILAHSETGHHHVVDANLADRFIDQMNDFISYLSVSSDVEIEHLRSFDTHDPLLLTPGLYEVRRQREYVPEGFRRVED